jgi:hypothetical protein
MIIGSIGSSALSPAFSLRARSSANDSSSDTAATQPSSGDSAAGGIYVVPLAQSSTVLAPSDLTGSSGLNVQESHLALQISSRTEWRTASDGTVSERASAKLLFHYDLTTADGQHIELSVKARVQQVAIKDAAGNSGSKTEVKLQFSLLQEGVANGLSPLQSDQVPSDTQSGVADGLQGFLNSVGDVLQHFVEGDKVTADDLVKKTVDSFNTLVDALTNLFHPAGSEAPPALPASGAALGQTSVIAAPPLDNPNLSPSQPAGSSPPPVALSPLPAQGGLTSEPSKPETPTVASGDNSILSVPAISADPIPSDQAAATSQPATAEGSVAPPANPSAAASPAQLATQVLQTVRVGFVESLTQIIQTLTPVEQHGNNSAASYQRLDYQSSVSLRIDTASLIDVNV